jgi:hypothetical protein
VSAAAGSSAAVDCAEYVALAGSRRCRFFEDGGGCAIAGRSECVVWRRANPGLPGPAAEAPGAPQRLQQELFAGAQEPAPAPRRPAAAPSPTPAQRRAPGADSGAALAGPVSEADVAAFRGMHAEVCLDLPGLGETWIVPELTGQDRREILPEQLAFLANTAAAFPGSRVVALRRVARAEGAPGGAS